MKHLWQSLLCLSLLACSGGDEPSKTQAGLDGTLLSNGSSSIIEIVADGSFNPNETPSTLPRAQMTAIPGRWQTDYVVRDVLGWDDDQIAADQQAAVDWFISQYGLDPTDPALDGRLVYEDTVLDSRAGFRVAMAVSYTHLTLPTILRV